RPSMSWFGARSWCAVFLLFSVWEVMVAVSLCVRGPVVAWFHCSFWGAKRRPRTGRARGGPAAGAGAVLDSENGRALTGSAATIAGQRAQPGLSDPAQRAAVLGAVSGDVPGVAPRGGSRVIPHDPNLRPFRRCFSK